MPARGLSGSFRRPGLGLHIEPTGGHTTFQLGPGPLPVLPLRAPSFDDGDPRWPMDQPDVGHRTIAVLATLAASVEELLVDLGPVERTLRRGRRFGDTDMHETRVSAPALFRRRYPLDSVGPGQALSPLKGTVGRPGRQRLGSIRSWSNQPIGRWLDRVRGQTGPRRRRPPPARWQSHRYSCRDITNTPGSPLPISGPLRWMHGRGQSATGRLRGPWPPDSPITMCWPISAAVGSRAASAAGHASMTSKAPAIVARSPWFRLQQARSRPRSTS